MKRVIAFGAVSDQGAWPLQEDAYWIDPARGVFVLADGFGGEKSGDAAAAAAVSAAGEFLVSIERDKIAGQASSPFLSVEESQISEAFRLAAEAVGKLNEGRDWDMRGGASLVVAVFFASGRAVVGNLGCTSAVILREGRVIQIAQAQSYAAHQGETVGNVDAVTGQDFPLQFLGLYSKVDPDIRTFHFQSKDHLLLCTEGLLCGRPAVLSQVALLVQTEPVAGGEAHEASLETIARDLIELSGASGQALRNRSVILAECASV